MSASQTRLVSVGFFFCAHESGLLVCNAFIVYCFVSLAFGMIKC